MRRYRFIDTTAYSQYLFKLALDKVVISGTASALTSTARRGHFIIPPTSSSGRVIYSKNADKIVANANGLQLYVAAENKSYPLRARKSYQAEGSDYIYIEFINSRSYSDAALEARRKLDSLNLDELTPWIWNYGDDENRAPTTASATRPYSKNSSAQNEKLTPFDLLALLFCLSMQGAFIGAFVGASAGFMSTPFVFSESGTMSEGIKNVWATWFMFTVAGAAIGAAPITYPTFKVFEYASGKIQDAVENSRQAEKEKYEAERFRKLQEAREERKNDYYGGGRRPFP